MKLFRTALLMAAMATPFAGFAAPWAGLQAAEVTSAPAAQAAPAAPPPATPAAPQATPSPAAAAAPAAADVLPTVPAPKFPEEETKLNDWKDTLDRVEATLRSRVTTDEALDNLRGQAAGVLSDSSEFISAITPRLEAAKLRLKQIEPAKGAPSQSDAVKLERAKLQAEVTARQDVAQQAQLTNVRAQQAVDTILNLRRTLFANSVLRRSQSLINPSFWLSVGRIIPTGTSHLVELGEDWSSVLAERPLRAAAGLFIVLILLAGYYLSPARRWVSRWTRRDPALVDPGNLRRSRAATVSMVVTTAIPGIALLVFYQTLMALGMLPDDEIASILRAVCFGLTFVFFFYGLTDAMLAPGRPSWRIVGVEDVTADGLVPVAVGAALVAAFSLLMHAVNRAINAPLELSVASQGVTGVATALLFVAALRIVARGEADEEDGEDPSAVRSAWRLLIPIGWIVALAALLGPIIGYVTFGRFVAGEMLVVVTVLMTLMLLSQFADAVIIASFAPDARVGHFMRHTVGLRGGAVRQMAVVLSGIAQLILLGLAVFLLLATWGIQSSDLVGSMSSAFFSIKIGSFTLSLSAIFGALVALVIGIMATRAFLRWLDGRLLPQTNLDIGLRTSIRTGLGYLGAVVAVLVALSIAGLNLQNLAIVAGALSVGIGFGLQAIVNNFVSGLILLVERPFKVGDRIEVGDRVGIVKRITVRATEVMTFDNASVIVPNADLVTGQVVNWMHGDFSGRLSVNVGTSYESDPDKVIALLLEIVGQHPRVLKRPPPFAILGEFGADALMFTVFFYVGNMGTDAGAANDVRLAVLKRFREEGIEIPYTQRDIRFLDLDRLEALIRSLAQGRSAPNAKAEPETEAEAEADNAPASKGRPGNGEHRAKEEPKP